MDAILEHCPGCIGIADDVAVYGRDKEEHDRNLINLMRVAEKEGLVFNSQKCIVRANEIPFFGMIYSADGARTDPARIEAIQSLPAPENVTELQEFLGIATYMATFVPRLSHHTATLQELLKQDTEFSWTAAHDQEFRKVKDLICRETTLAYFDPNKESVLQVDSSLRGLGVVLMQEGRPIAFASKSLTDTESRYANIERELLAVVYGCERFHTYLYGKPFTAQSDHKPLEMIQLKNLHAAPPRLQRMLLRLQNYDVTIKYQPGKTLLLADGLSRLPGAKQSAEIKLDVAINLVHFSQERVQELRDKTARDPILAPLRDLIIRGWPDTFKQVTKPLRPYWSYRDELSIEDGIILKGSEQVLIPAAMQEYILDALHAGHQGRDKCQLRARRSVFWNGINDDIAKCVAKCPICQEEASSQRKEPLVQKDIPPRAWHTISADFFDLMGKVYLLVADHFSKFPFIKCLPWDCSSKTTQETLKALFSVHGAPEICTLTMARSLLHTVSQNFVMSGMCNTLHHRLITLNRTDSLRAWWRLWRKHCAEHTSLTWTPTWLSCVCGPHPWAAHCPHQWRCWWAARLNRICQWVSGTPSMTGTVFTRHYCNAKPLKLRTTIRMPVRSWQTCT